MTKNTAPIPNIWEKNNIPALEYCNLTRAAEILNCKTSDIIHFIEIGAIETCLKLDGFEATLLLPLNDRDPEVWDDAFFGITPLQKVSKNNKLSLFSPVLKNEYSFDTEIKSQYLYEYNDTPGLKTPLMRLYGLWALKIDKTSDFTFYQKLQDNMEVSLTALDFVLFETDQKESPYGIDSETIVVSPKSEHLYPNGMIDIEKLRPIITITKNDLYITKYQIEKISNSIGKSLPSYITGDIERIDNLNEDKSPRNQPSLTATQFSFMYKLLRVIGLSDDVIRTYSVDRLSRTLAKKAAAEEIDLPFPDKNTWAKWRDKFPK